MAAKRNLRTKPADHSALMLDAALAYARRGLPIFPCNAIKEPLVANGVLDATTDAQQIERWWRKFPDANVALAVGDAGLLVLDYDPGSDRDQLDRDLGGLPKTRLRSKTPRGGIHEFYALQPGEIVPNSASKIAPHVDVRSFHGYVLLPPSRTADGEYTWLSEGKPAHRTDEMRRLASIVREKDPNHHTWLIDPDLAENVAACIKWLREDAKPAFEGQGGDNMAYATAAMCKSYGISEETAFDLMLEHWNPRCSPPWGADEVDHLQTKVANAYEYSTSAPGNRTEAYWIAKGKVSFKPVVRATNDNKQAKPDRFAELVKHFQSVLAARGNPERRAMRFRDTTSITPVEWIIEGWLSRDATWLLYGESEAFKTYITLNMLLCVATGTPWAARDGFAGYRVGAPRPVILFAGESYRGVVQRVNAAILAGCFNRKLVEENLILVPDVYSLNFAEGLAHMADEIEALGVRPAIIAVDTLNLALDGDEDNSLEIKCALRGLRALATMFGATGLAIDHVGHGDKSRPRGSSAKKANSDGMILCERDGTSTVVNLSQQKNRDDDKTLYRATFAGNRIELGMHASNLSFSAIKPPAASNSKAEASERAAFEDRTNEKIVSDALLNILKASKAKWWSDRALSRALATDDAIEIGEEAIRKTWLSRIRSSKTDPARRCYDRIKGQWIYREEGRV